jgi:serpin B
MQKPKRYVRIAAILLLFVAVGTGIGMLLTNRGQQSQTQIPSLPSVQASPIESYTGFALKFALLSGLGDKNTAVSPYSVYQALLMLTEGSAGDTRSELLGALQLSSQAEAREWFRSSTQRFLSVQQPARTAIANSIWIREGVPVKQTYVDILREYYLAEEYSFSEPLDATKRINLWVYDKTYRLIDKIMDHLDQSAIIVLVNTVYLKANWTTPFENTFNDTFNSPRGPVTATYLSGTVNAKVLETDSYIAVALGYVGTDIKFVAIMPKKADLKSFMTEISEKDLLGIFTELMKKEDERVKLVLPRFDIDSGIIELVPLLKQMGIKKVFDPDQADLSEMLDTSKLAGKAFASNVFHRARVKVDLYGTEAAAATAIVIKVTAVPGELKTIRIDRPFAFFLVDPSTHAILFAGSYVEP